MWVSLPMLGFSFFPVLCQRRGHSSGSFFSIGKSKLKFLLRNLKPQLTILNHFLKIPELPVDQTHYTENNKSSSSTKLHSKAVVWGESKETNKQKWQVELMLGKQERDHLRLNGAFPGARTQASCLILFLLLCLIPRCGWDSWFPVSRL